MMFERKGYCCVLYTIQYMYGIHTLSAEKNIIVSDWRKKEKKYFPTIVEWDIVTFISK